MAPLLNLFLSMVSILISVAFYTILERKTLSYIQIRKGPNKVGFLGVLQPFSDAIKLFNKSLNSSELMNFSLSMISPMLTLFLALLLLSIIPFFNFSNFDNKHSILSFMIISSLNVYMVMMMGWASNSKYAYIGTIRSLAQMISYEISFFLIILFTSIMASSYHFTLISETQAIMWFSVGHSTLLLMWVVSCLAEVNRSPFDFAEGESELVSGFNVEYMGGWFALIFLAEYANMIILSMITVIMFFYSLKSSTSFISLLLISILFLWARGTLPRFRYDLLMYLSWKMLLPAVLLVIPFATLVTYLSM